jgi:hypothetical protein
VAGSKHKHGASRLWERRQEQVERTDFGFVVFFCDWLLQRRPRTGLASASGGWVETVESSCCPTWAQPTGTRFPCIACHLNFGIPWAPHARLRSGPALFLPSHSSARGACPEVALGWPRGCPAAPCWGDFVCLRVRPRLSLTPPQTERG